MPPSSADTRRKLIDAATRAFADDGIFSASLIEITRQAGQKNRGALHYHFGSREGALCAVLEAHAPFLARREGELLAEAQDRPAGDVTSVVEAIVRPAVELAESGWRGRCFLQVLAQLVEEDQTKLDPDVAAALAHTGGYEVYALLADRARARERRARGGREQLDLDGFVTNLVAMVAAMLTAPTPTAPARVVRHPLT